MKIIKSRKFGGATPRDVATNMVPQVTQPIAPVAPAPAQQVPAQQVPANQPAAQSNIIKNKDPLNIRMIRNKLKQFVNYTKGIEKSIDNLPDNEIELLLSGINQKLQLVFFSAAQGGARSQMPESRIVPQMRQMVQETAKVQ